MHALILFASIILNRREQPGARRAQAQVGVAALHGTRPERLPSSASNGAAGDAARSELVVLDVVEDEGEGLGLLAVSPDHHGGGALDLSRLALLVVGAVAEPLSKIVAGGDLEERDLGLGGQSLQQETRERDGGRVHLR